MKVLVQRVKEASVLINDKIHGSITHGLLLYVCFELNDNIESVEAAIMKVKLLRIFEDYQEKMNQNVSQVNGSILSISQFTLSWDGKKGHRPSFDKSLPPAEAKILYRIFNDRLIEEGIKLEKGIFGSDMQVSSVNDGPVTFLLEF